MNYAPRARHNLNISLHTEYTAGNARNPNILAMGEHGKADDAYTAESGFLQPGWAAEILDSVSAQRRDRSCVCIWGGPDKQPKHGRLQELGPLYCVHVSVN